MHVVLAEDPVSPPRPETATLCHSLLTAEIPILSIQPLVENAVKHGVACRERDGFVHLSVQRAVDSVIVAVSNSGVFRESGTGQDGHGIGMANVRRRLDLYYGSGDLEVSTVDDVTTVRFRVPVPKTEQLAARSGSMV